MKKTSLRRRAESHKGDYGHVLVIAGSRGLVGAARMCAQAALAAGAGKVTLGTPREVYPLVARRLDEVMTLPLRQTKNGALSAAALPALLEFSRWTDAVAIGPGLSTEPSTQRLVAALLTKLRLPIVIDADAINCLEGRARMLRFAYCPPVVTPHGGEYRRLSGRAVARFSDRAEIAKKFAGQYHCILVLKGHRTVVAAPGRVFVNRTGNPGMATAGTGDVLTGMIAGFIAQGFDSFFAACLAVHAHGLAGDAAAAKKGRTALVATDLLAHLPAVLKRLERVRSLRRHLRI